MAQIRNITPPKDRYETYHPILIKT